MQAQLAISAEAIRRSPGCAALFDPHGKVLAASSSWERACGLEGEAYLGRRIEAVIPGVSPDVLALHRRASKGEHLLNEGELLVDGSGHRRWFHCEYRPFLGLTGEPGYYSVNAIDITPLVEARREAQVNAERLTLALGAARAGVFEVDLLNHSVWCSPDFPKLVGRALTYDEMTDIWPMVHPEDRARAKEAAVASRDSLVVAPHEVRMVSPGGETRWVEVRAVLQKTSDGVSSKIVGVVLDVDERKRQELANAELRQQAQINAQRLELALDAARVGVVEIDLVNRTIWNSPEVVDILGEEARFYAQDTPPWPMCHPDDRERLDQHLKSRTSPRLEPIEFRIVQPSGGSRWIEMHSVLERDENGAPAKAIALIVDIDDRKRQELALAGAQRESQANAERLRLALDAAGAGVFETNFKARTFWCSPQLTNILGREMSYEEASGAWPMIHPDDVARLDELAADAMRTGKAHGLEMRIILPSGEIRWIESRVENHGGEQGGSERVVGLILDIDVRKRQELALIDAEQAAQAAAEAKVRFLSNMSHELRTPMTGVLGVLHLLAQEPLTDHGRHLLGEAEGCGRMLAQLLNDILDFSKIEAGRLELSPEPMDAAGVLESVVAMRRPDAERKGVALRTRVEGDGWILADPVRIRQVIFNMIGNAVKFTEAGHVEARLIIRDDGGGGKRLRLEVEDTGIGIPDSVRASLFQRFQQADGSMSRRFGGSGLGLAITRSLADLMGGEVDVESVEGAGSTFWFEAPVRSAPVVAPEAAVAQETLEGLSVLVVEDNPTNRKVIALILEAMGAKVDTACDGLEGLEAAQARGYDLVLMDVQMPRMDGVEATRRIRMLATPAALTPIIGLTANALDHQRREYLAAGMNGVAAKPISPPALIAEIERVCADRKRTAAA